MAKSTVIRVDYFVSAEEYAYGVHIWDLGVESIKTS
jgi:hypothetical protein